MADKMISLENIRSFWLSQVHDPEKWDLNVKLFRAAGLFAGSIFVMRQYGEMMAI